MSDYVQLEIFQSDEGEHPRARCRVVVELDIEGKEDDALTVIDGLLDNGVYQNPINGHDNEDCGGLRVLSAVVKTAEGLSPAERGRK